MLAGPILKLLYPSVPDGELILRLLTISLPFSSINFILNGILYGMGKSYVPAIALTAGSVIKLGLNIVLVNIKSINIYGAVFSTVVYNILIFAVELFFVARKIKLKVDLKKCFIKPIFASAVMGVAVFFIYKGLASVSSNTLATLISILSGMIIYGICLIVCKNFEKEDIISLPMGSKIASALEKVGLI